MSDETTKTLKRLLRGEIQHIDITVTTRTVVARAIPSTFHPLVAKRREQAFAERAGSISIDEAEAIQTAARRAVAQGTGKTIDEALAVLEAGMKG